MALHMNSKPPLKTLRGLQWLVAARNEIQTLMLRLWQHWEQIEEPSQRKAALDAAFSLWRAAFLLIKGDTELVDSVDTAAKTFLEKSFELTPSASATTSNRGHGRAATTSRTLCTELRNSTLVGISTPTLARQDQMKRSMS